MHVFELKLFCFVRNIIRSTRCIQKCLGSKQTVRIVNSLKFNQTLLQLDQSRLTAVAGMFYD